MKFANGYSLTFDFNVDGLGILYISIAVVWTLVLLCGSIFLLQNRKLPYLRIRNIPLSIGAVATIHVYLVLTLIAYVLNGNFPCATEFWIMSIYLPLGIALYQAANTQLLHVAMLQKQFAPRPPSVNFSRPLVKQSRWQMILNKLRSTGPTKRAMTLIGIGMAVQFVFALLVFIISKKFHAAFGLVEWQDKPDDSIQQAAQCRRGWEWWPSIAWQFAWSWLYAPYLLYKVIYAPNSMSKTRGIEDTHGWRKQTIWCCLAGLPGSPMWLAALYIPAMHQTNTTFVPPLWFAPSIILMQGFVIFLPCYQVFKNRRLEDDTRQIIAEWEHKKKYGSTFSSDSTTPGSRKSRISAKTSTSSIRSCRNPELYTLSSLEKTLQLNPKPLLLFAALKDFSGENISFLTHVLEWKSQWFPTSPIKTSFLRKANDDDDSDSNIDSRLRRQQFTLALRIYSSFVSLQYSDFPINISSTHLKELDSLFADAAFKTNKQSTPVSSPTPFNDFDDIEKSPRVYTTDPSSTTTNTTTTGPTIPDCPEGTHYAQVQSLKYGSTTAGGNTACSLPPDIQVPAAFGPSVFDRAEASIRELVLTNTWPKFVNAGYANNIEKTTLKDRVEGWKCNVNGLWARVVGLLPKGFVGGGGGKGEGEGKGGGGVRESEDERTLV